MITRHLSTLVFAARGIIYAVLLLAFGGTCFGQSTTSSAAITRGAALRLGVTQSVAAFEAGDVAAAVTALQKMNASTPGTANWHRENALRLVDVAATLRTTRKYAHLQDAVQQALAELSTARLSYSAVGDSRRQAQVWSETGFVYEYFLSDFRSALSCYESAVKLDPKSRNAALHVRLLKRQLAVLGHK